ncbi:uncharacterized protein LOC124404724 [Diprion similis]|uniref:uncharacterized protein LOC124404724 n=1 Tax=Diprion similis TaxID=362088 RepID=UPI001EF8B9BD|nr:uncharacterized protein LOC124404724 [Diprion similis]
MQKRLHIDSPTLPPSARRQKQKTSFAGGSSSETASPFVSPFFVETFFEQFTRAESCKFVRDSRTTRKSMIQGVRLPPLIIKMPRLSNRRIVIAALFVVAVALPMKNVTANSTTSLNLTETMFSVDDDGEDMEFKDRYRRLIPYMTFYVSNNNVNQQSQSQSSTPYKGTMRISPNVQRRPAPPVPPASHLQYNNYGTRNNHPTGVGSGAKKTQQYYVSPPAVHHEKFIPSVQYDPKDMDNEEYFTPVRYTQSPNIDDYQSSYYQRLSYQTPRPTTSSSTLRVNEHQHQQRPLQLYFTTHRPTTTKFTPAGSYAEILVRKESLPKRPTQRPLSKPYVKYDQGETINYSGAEFEPQRYARPQPFRHPEQVSAPLQSSSSFPSFSSSSHQLGQRHRNPSTQANLNHIIQSLQLTNQLPEMLNADNIDESIKTLVEILSLLNNGRKYELPHSQQNSGSVLPVVDSSSKYVQEYQDEYQDAYQGAQARPKPSAKRPFEPTRIRPIVVQDNTRPSNGPYHVNVIDVIGRKYLPTVLAEDQKEATGLSERPVIVETTTSQGYKIDEETPEDPPMDDNVAVTIFPLTTEEPAAQNYPPPDGASSHVQNFPPTPLKYGATRGKPNVDYPAYATIPKTEFSCATQRYKGFFGDPDTGCQVWHYCDLNGGMSSFLCPNGTIFSQVALTCDWWFNVKCESTAQLYVLNERLYKYILPVMPKFPEDFSGPEVDRYLELKFKEMEAKMKEKKLRKQQMDKNKTKNSTQVEDNVRQ